jgi:transposase
MSYIRKFKKGGHTYLAEVESKRINGKVTQRFIRYVGKEANGRTILSTSMSDAQIDEVRSYGPLLVLHHLAEKINLRDHLGGYANEILSMVYAHCLDYRSVNQMQGWFERTDLNMLLDIEGLTESRLLGAMDFIERTDLEGLQRNIFHSVKQSYQLQTDGVIYDVTNTYLYGKKCPLGKLGHDKDQVKGRPLIQIGLGVTKDDGIPMFHKTFDGNIHDSRTLQDMITVLRSYQIESGIIIYDRGVTSAENIVDVKQLKWDTICGVALTENVKKFWRPVIKKSTRLSLKDRIQLNETNFYVITRPYSIGHVKGELHLCFNARQQLDIRDSRRDEIVHAQNLLKNRKAIKSGLEQYFDKSNNIINSALDKAEEFDGYSCIFATCQVDKDQLIHYYFDKDIIEKAFRSLKGVVKLQPIRHWLYQRVVAHIFICYLAYLLLSLLKRHLKPLGMSPEAALHELETMYKVYLRDPKRGFKISRLVTLTKKQEKILRAVDKKLLALES